MPRREDEYWAGMKEPQGRGLCPFCGSSRIYYNKRYESWRCTKCEKSFPTPSYGPGEDFGKEARWFGKTTEEMRRREFAEAAKKKKESVRAEHKNEAVSSGKAWFGSEYYDRKSKRWRRSGRGRMSWTVLPIFVLFIASVVILYYVFSNFEQFDRAVAIGIVSAAAVTIIWLVATLGRLWRFRPRGVGLGKILLSLILLALIGCTVGAYAGVEPLSSAKGEVVAWFQDLGSQTPERGLPPASDTGQGKPEGQPIEPFDGKQPPYSKTFGIPIHLTNNSSATDPTWQQLMSFLIADKADQKDYNVFLFPCGAFAEEVHNNAEAAGIRAAWVAVDFEDNSERHALNAFETVDKGLVYIDCTGGSLLEELQFTPVTQFVPGLGEVTVLELNYPSSYDKVAYVVVSKEYGLISLDVATSPQYSVYEAYLAKREEYEMALETYNQEVESYNQALGGRTVLGEPEYSRFVEWHGRLNAELAELEMLSEEVGDFYWQSLGVVANIEIYW